MATLVNILTFLTFYRFALNDCKPCLFFCLVSSAVILQKCQLYKPPRPKKEAVMQVVAIHTIHDPEGFQKAEAEAMKNGLPPEFKLPVHGATKDHSKGICLWEGPSVKAVQELVDSVVGQYSKNEYYEMTMHGMDQLSPEPLAHASASR
jgi:hypothetical protein